jgi:hypothetical protein
MSQAEFLYGPKKGEERTSEPPPRTQGREDSRPPRRQPQASEIRNPRETIERRMRDAEDEQRFAKGGAVRLQYKRACGHRKAGMK